MGKATGFMDYDRQDKMVEDPKKTKLLKKTSVTFIYDLGINF